MASNWQKAIVHPGLNAYRMVRGSTEAEVDLKARLQLAAWDKRWKKRQETDARHRATLAHKSFRERQADLDREARAIALERTKEAERALERLDNLLQEALSAKAGFDWNRLRDEAPFSTPSPTPPELKTWPREPQRSDSHFQVSPACIELSVIDRIIPALKRAKVAKAQAAENIRRNEVNQLYAQAHASWKQIHDEAEKFNTAAKLAHGVAQAVWLKAQQSYDQEQINYNAGLVELRKKYLVKDPEAIARFSNEVLAHSDYPDFFPRDSVASFDSATGMLVVDFELPPQMEFPRLKQVKYVSTRKEFQDADMSETEFRRVYDNVLYQVCFRSLHELFQADEINTIGSVVFNGWVRAVDKATGADTHPCILSVQVKKSDFQALNLAQIDLKTCFRSLKGISGGRLTDFSPVRPVISINKNDPRFVAAYAVADSLDEKTNLAAMDWLDFENLIRELFEKEFSKDGGEVKITQASRDGGVDAVAFDPDPIRGGKIVIQAKRYTNTVGVSAVRDLYGTVHNEGATKGILVTTSDYGPDAYEFVKGKPLTLLSGSELLYLLERHGYRAKIDLKDAKRMLGEI